MKRISFNRFISVPGTFSDQLRMQGSPFEIDSDTQIDCVLGIFNSATQVDKPKALTSDLGKQTPAGTFFVFDNFTTFSSVGRGVMRSGCE